MWKNRFISLIRGTIGVFLFGLSMCVAMLPKWNAFQLGNIIGIIGAVILLIMDMVLRKTEGKSVIVNLSAKAVGTVVLGIVGAIVLGVGMCLVIVWSMLVQGVIIGLIGIILLLCQIPLVKRASFNI